MPEHTPTATPSPFRILVIANETIDGHSLRHAVAEHSADTSSTEVLIVCPALNSRLRFWVSDVDRARRAAETRLHDSLQGLGGEGIEAEGAVGDSDPLLAIADGLRVFAADEILLVTHPTEEAHWVEQGLVERARSSFPSHPIFHILASAHADDRRLRPVAA